MCGTNRFDKPCTNTVVAAGGYCGRCTGSRLAPNPNSPAPPEPEKKTEKPEPPKVRDLHRQPASEDLGAWTVSNDLLARLSAIAGDNEDLLALVDVGARLASNSRANNTKHAYDQHWRTFVAFCEAYELPTGLPTPPEHVAFFIAFLQHGGRTDPATGDRTGEPLSHGYIRQAVAAIGHRHQLDGLLTPVNDPIVRGLLQGYAREHGTASKGKDPLGYEHVAVIARGLAEPPPSDARDLTLCLLATNPTQLISASALARLDGERLVLPKSLAEPMVLFLSSRGTTGLDPVEVHPTEDSRICPVGAMRSLAPDPYGPVFRKPDNTRLGRTSIDHIVNRKVEQARSSSAELQVAISLLFGHPTGEDLRNRALITNLYWGCFRASELTARTWRHVKIVDQGIEWRITQDKTNQQGSIPRVTGVPRHEDPFLCPVLALEDWRRRLTHLLGRAPKPTDPVFPRLDRGHDLTQALSVQSVNRTVQRTAERFGIAGTFGSHSLRSGFTTDAINHGATREQVQHHGGWRNATSLDPYIRRTAIWATTNPALRLNHRTA